MSTLTLPNHEPWNPRRFVIPEDQLIDEMCWARLMQPDRTILVGYGEDDIHTTVTESTWAILKMLHHEGV